MIFAAQMLAFGPKQTCAFALHLPAFGGKADILDLTSNSLMRQFESLHALPRRNFHDRYFGVRMVHPMKVDVIAAGALSSKPNCCL